MFINAKTKFHGGGSVDFLVVFGIRGAGQYSAGRIVITQSRHMYNR